MSRLIPFALICCFSISVLADDKPAASELSPEEMQELFMKMSQPGPQHKYLASIAGEWHCECKNYEMDPENPMTSEAASTIKSILGGRYIEQHFKGDFQGMEFVGRGLSGYDNAQQKFVGTWIDSFSTGIMHTEGQYDESTNTMTEMGKIQTPIGEMSMKMVTKHHSKDKFHFTMYMINPDGPKKHMEILYTRKK